MELKDFFTAVPKAALGLSGGADSAGTPDANRASAHDSAYARKRKDTVFAMGLERVVAMGSL